jgi:hypothetical protein
MEPSVYTVTASVTGYKKFDRKDVPVGLQQFVTLDMLLEVGAIEESITVTGESPLVDTSNASTGGVLDKSTLDSAPTIGRNVYLMSYTIPTVVASGDTHWNRMQDQTGSSMLSLGGGGVRANNYLIDGYPTTDIVNRSSTVPSIEAVEEVKVQVHTYDAEMGRTGGGTFNAAAKSGSNKFHGARSSCPITSSSLSRRGSRNPIRTGTTSAVASAVRSSRARRSSGSPARRIATACRRTATSCCRPRPSGTATSRGSPTRAASRSPSRTRSRACHFRGTSSPRT